MTREEEIEEYWTAAHSHTKYEGDAMEDIRHLLDEVKRLREIASASEDVVQAMRDQHYYEWDCSGCEDNLHNANAVLGTLDAALKEPRKP